MLLHVRHNTRYDFSQPATKGLQRLRLRPKPTHGQVVHWWTTELVGGRIEVEYDDHHNNHIALVSLEPGASSLSITCSGSVETADRAGVVGQHTGLVPLWLFLRQTDLTKPGPRMRSVIGQLQGDKADTLALLHGLSSAVLNSLAYEAGHTDAKTSGEQALELGHGVCQDHAHVFIGCARSLGIPARYVGGYLMMNDRVEQEAGHAWAEAHIPGLGWVGFDVSNGISPDARYVRVATGCDYRDAAPVTGLAAGIGEAAMAVSLAVEQQTAEQ